MLKQATRGLNVAVTGHRLNRISRRELERLSPQVLPVLACLGDSSRAPSPTLVSSLAEGADRFLASLALEMGYGLQAVLPFERTVYLQDFSCAASRDEFRSLLDRADHVVELAGHQGAGAQAYRRAGHALLACADLLLAVWDGGPSRGSGGTADVVAEACRRRMPVVHVSTRVDEAPVLLWRRSGRGELAEPLGGPGGVSHLAAVVSHLTRARP